MPTGVALEGAELTRMSLREDAMLPALAPTTGNKVRLLTDEHEVLPELLASVRGAKSSIDLSMFALADSGAGKTMVDELVARARDGVDVRVTLDQVGSALIPMTSAARMVDRLRDAGAAVAINQRVHLGGVNAVDHRKMLVVDGTTAYTGGMNLSKRFGDWHDVMVRVDGPAAQQFHAQFVDRWADMEEPTAMGAKALASPPPTAGSGTSAVAGAAGGVALLVNHPGKELQASDHLLDNLASAKSRAWVLTPTLSDPAVVAALVKAASRGVDVRVAVSGPEGWIGTRALGLIGSTFYGELIAGGVKIYEQPGMSHAKVSLVDDVASAGSLNMTRRAMLWDHELMLASDDPSFVGQIQNLFTTDFGRSTLVTAERANTLSARVGAAVRKKTGLKW